MLNNNSSWDRCIEKDLSTNYFKESDLLTSNYASYQELFIEWALNQYNFNSIKKYVFDLPFGRYYRVSVELKLDSNRLISGVGRAKDETQALSKALGEAVERIIALEIMEKGIKGYSTVIKKPENISFSSDIDSVEKYHIPKSFRSSNGWAVHFSKEKALANSMLEAVERHILLYSYLKDNWSAFYPTKAYSYDNFPIKSLFSKYSFGGFVAGMCLVKNKVHPGVTMGYLCDEIPNIESSSYWEKAFFEAFEPALAYSEQKEIDIENTKSMGYYHIKQSQNHYLSNEAPISFDETNRDIDTLQSNHILECGDIKCNQVVYNVSSKFNLSFPFYIAYTYGGNLIPLFFSNKMEKEDKDTLYRVLEYHKLKREMPRHHPVL